MEVGEMEVGETGVGKQVPIPGRADIGYFTAELLYKHHIALSFSFLW